MFDLITQEPYWGCMTKPVLLVSLIQIIAMEKVNRNKFIPHLHGLSALILNFIRYFPI